MDTSIWGLNSISYGRLWFLLSNISSIYVSSNVRYKYYYYYPHIKLCWLNFRKIQIELSLAGRYVYILTDTDSWIAFVLKCSGYVFNMYKSILSTILFNTIKTYKIICFLGTCVECRPSKNFYWCVQNCCEYFW